jgi:hypothetical protein
MTMAPSDRTTLATWATTTQPKHENNRANKAVMHTSILSLAASSSWLNDNLDSHEDDGHSANMHNTYSNRLSVARFPQLPILALHNFCKAR